MEEDPILVEEDPISVEEDPISVDWDSDSGDVNEHKSCHLIKNISTPNKVSSYLAEAAIIHRLFELGQVQLSVS